MNGIDNRSNVYAKRLMRLKLAELNELVRLGAGMPGDEQRIEMIKGLLGQWHMDESWSKPGRIGACELPL